MKRLITNPGYYTGDAGLPTGITGETTWSFVSEGDIKYNTDIEASAVDQGDFSFRANPGSIAAGYATCFAFSLTHTKKPVLVYHCKGQVCLSGDGLVMISPYIAQIEDSNADMNRVMWLDCDRSWGIDGAEVINHCRWDDHLVRHLDSVGDDDNGFQVGFLVWNETGSAVDVDGIARVAAFPSEKPLTANAFGI